MRGAPMTIHLDLLWHPLASLGFPSLDGHGELAGDWQRCDEASVVQWVMPRTRQMSLVDAVACGWVC